MLITQNPALIWENRRGVGLVGVDGFWDNGGNGSICELQIAHADRNVLVLNSGYHSLNVAKGVGGSTHYHGAHAKIPPRASLGRDDRDFRHSAALVQQGDGRGLFR